MRVPQLLLTLLSGVLFAACTTNQDGVAVISEVDAATPAPPAPRIQTPEVEPKERSRQMAKQEPRKKPSNASQASNSPPPETETTGTSAESKARATLEQQAKDFARQNGGKLPTADQVGAMAGKIDANSIQKATDLINEHKGQLPNKAELQQLIDQIDPATIEKAKKALQDSGLLETLEGQL